MKNTGKRLALTALVLTTLASCGETVQTAATPEPAARPNIVLIYLDDLGYGDTGAYGATELQTPHMDALAAAGIRFTNGYAASATCTPSRYALLTGTYPWRKREARILPGDAPLLIDTTQRTLPKLLRQQGYATGIVGKWHLGLGNGGVDWNGRVSPGPNEVGFDYSYILAATQDRVPTVYIQNGQVVGLDPEDPISVNYQTNFPGEPTALTHPEMVRMPWDHGHNNSIVNGIPRIGFMKGGEDARWVDEDMADIFLAEAQGFVQAHKGQPFFLYYALQQPHVPRTPHPRFEGKTGLGPRGDVIYEADWCIGQFMETLRREGLLENTLVILTSDNGPVLNDGYVDQAVELNGSHTPWGPLRGGKYSLFEAGTRVPFLVSWPGRITPGTSDAIISQVDLLASLTRIAGIETDLELDSRDLSEVLLGTSDQGRESLVLQATGRTALRKGNWLLIPPHEGPPVATHVNIETGNDPEVQLYNLETDVGQRQNIAQDQPEKLQEMIAAYESLTGRSVSPGEE